MLKITDMLLLGIASIGSLVSCGLNQIFSKTPRQTFLLGS